jgi:hypothetical protein|tara:strand:- start:348 stop:611 length:264 start_codon:yes stop_codon:yes gene_type:complete
MASYPKFSVYREIQDINDLYNEILSWGNRLTSELDIRDEQVDNKQITNVRSVVTVTDIGRPQAGDVAFSLGESKFKGYTGSAWVDFH